MAKLHKLRGCRAIPRPQENKELSSSGAKMPPFGEVIRKRRRELDFTQEEVAGRIKASTSYVGHLESGKRHPSDKIVTRLAKVLGIDRHKLRLLANPHAPALLGPDAEGEAGSVWEQFRKDAQLRWIHNVSNKEMEMLSRAALLGEITSLQELIFILNTVRHAIGRWSLSA